MSNPTTSDLIFSSQANNHFSRTLTELKRSTLSIRNRLVSIQHDAAYVQRVADAFAFAPGSGSERPLIANERCGSWYLDPQPGSGSGSEPREGRGGGEGGGGGAENGRENGGGSGEGMRRGKGGSAYFKSTDGHTGVWKFSSRRLNLHLLDMVGRCDGCIIVDSTRRGKRMPDALSKTIPIWCAVINRLLFPTNSQYHQLYTPPQVVSESEHAQISALLPSFLLAIQALNLPVEDLQSKISKPLRPMWVTPESELAPSPTVFEDFHPIICCTASRRVAGGEMSEGGYIQGAGDDTENWAHGLTPSVFWSNKEILMSTPENELMDVIERLVEEVGGSDGGQAMRCLIPCSELYIGPIPALSESELRSTTTIVLLPKVTESGTWRTSSKRIDVGLGHTKIGSRNLRTALPSVIDFLSSTMSPNSGEDRRVYVACDTGKDLSIGVALAVLCLFCNDEGKLQERRKERVDKDFIRGRMSWISTAMPDANPSRATLQSVNAFLMKRD